MQKIAIAIFETDLYLLFYVFFLSLLHYLLFTIHDIITIINYKTVLRT